MTSFLHIFPPELPTTPGLWAGFVALLGLILCTAGIKIAKPLAAVLAGAALATFAASVLPALLKIDTVTAAGIGLAAGMLLGVTTFRLVQALVLALGLCVLASGAFFQWQVAHDPLPVANAVAFPLPPESSAGQVYAALPAHVQSTVRLGYAHWQTIPLTLRLSMLIVGLAAAILAVWVAWIMPRQTTWLMSAAVGGGLLLYGGLVLLTAYLPAFARQVPAEPRTRLVILLAIAAAGLLVQRFYFWPGQRQKRERANTRPGELAPA